MIPFMSIGTNVATPPLKHATKRVFEVTHDKINELNLQNQEFVDVDDSPTLVLEKPWTYLDFCTGTPSTPERRLFTQFQGYNTPTIHLLKNTSKQHAALAIQRVWRGWKQRRQFQETRKHIIHIQRLRRQTLEMRRTSIEAARDEAKDVQTQTEEASEEMKDMQTQTEHIEIAEMTEGLSLEEMLEKLNQVKKQKKLLEDEIARARQTTNTRPRRPTTPVTKFQSLQETIKREKEESVELEKLTKKNTALNTGHNVPLEIVVVAMEGKRPPSPSAAMKGVEDEERDYLANVDEKPSPSKKIRWAKKAFKKTPPKKGVLKKVHQKWSSPEQVKENVTVKRFVWPEEIVEQLIDFAPKASRPASRKKK
jgi:hypothetical protein